MNSLGFSTQTALSASRHVNFETPEKPDKVIKFFNNLGFTKTQISRLVRSEPRVLSSDSEKTLLPKLEFLESKGFSGPEMAKTLSVFPRILRSSLDQQIIPAYDFVRNLVQSDEKAVTAVKRYPDILVLKIEKCVLPNIVILREHGVPDSSIAKLMEHWPRSLMVKPDHFREAVKKVEDMGFESSRVNFVVALITFRLVSKSKWESKIDAYKKWGWSEDDVLKAFQMRPWCMNISEDKISAVLDFFTNKVGWGPCLIAKRLDLLSLSLEKRLIPRFSVYQVLLSKGLVKKELSSKFFRVPEEKFLQNFVMPYKEEAPELLKLYKGKIGLPNGAKSDKV